VGNEVDDGSRRGQAAMWPEGMMDGWMELFVCCVPVEKVDPPAWGSVEKGKELGWRLHVLTNHGGLSRPVATGVVAYVRAP
jgi:hypothetical protein